MSACGPSTEASSSILLVDDRPANLLALEAVLEPLSVPLIKATSGEDALRYVLHLGEKIALILLDVQMPGLDGFQTAALIRSRPRLEHVPIIFITAIHREEAHILKGYAYGAVDYVVKPFEPDSLRAKVRQFILIHQRQARLTHDKEQADERRHESEERLRLALDAARLGTWGWDASSGDIFFDERCASLLDLGGRPIDPSVVDIADFTETGDERFRFEFRAPNLRWLEFQGRPYRRPNGGKVTRILGTVEDISVRKRQRGERDLFLGALGHDLRNPLNAILIAASLLRRRTDPDVANMALRISSGANRMNSLISDLLDFVRSRSGPLPVQAEPTHLRSICQQVISEVEAAHPGSEVALEACDDDEGCWDPARLAQIVQNLVTNAVRHATPGTAARVAIHDRGDHVALDVENRGEAISEEVKSRIFEPLVSGAGRLGLGLYIANQLTLAHQGRIDVSRQGDRTVFTVILPRHHHDSPQKAAHSG